MLNVNHEFMKVLGSQKLKITPVEFNSQGCTLSDSIKIIIDSSVPNIDSSFYNKQLIIEFHNTQVTGEVGKKLLEVSIDNYNHNKLSIPSSCKKDQIKLTDHVFLYNSEVELIGHRLLTVLKYILEDYNKLDTQYPIIKVIPEYRSLNKIKFTGIINDIIIDIEFTDLLTNNGEV